MLTGPRGVALEMEKTRNARHGIDHATCLSSGSRLSEMWLVASFPHGYLCTSVFDLSASHCALCVMAGEFSIGEKTGSTEGPPRPFRVCPFCSSSVEKSSSDRGVRVGRLCHYLRYCVTEIVAGPPTCTGRQPHHGFCPYYDLGALPAGLRMLVWSSKR
ncbi:hypothetical protein BR93DRAFT_578035 [Coniochaeta sp. PMI_546]|nr:hypothetical protein BR93DRAFT_578035 [Coniochaeta sp. PMI_546]